MITVSVFLFLIGAAMGSFALATVWRLHKGRDFLRERSECENCHHLLGVTDLLPVISWLWLRGRCRYCKKKISPDHFLIEVALGCLFIVSFLWWPVHLAGEQWILFAFWLSYLVGAAMLFMYDLRWQLLPDRILFPLIGIALLGLLYNAVIITEDLSLILEAAAGIGVLAGFFGLLYAVSGGRWIGFGDVKLGVFMGLVLGMPASLVALVGSYYVAIIVVLPLLLIKKVTKKSYVPFGPFLLVSFFLSYFLSTALVQWITLQ